MEEASAARVRELLELALGQRPLGELRAAICRFQRAAGLREDGIVGGSTGPALEASAAARCAPELRDFRGQLGTLLRWEGYRGVPYWAGGDSGVTLDPGFDLGRQDAQRLRAVYGCLLAAEQVRLLEAALGVRGERARILARDAAYRAIEISAESAARILPELAAPCWRATAGRFRTLGDASVPQSVHTVLLSLAYHRGAHHPALEALRRSIDREDWWNLATLVSVMQQDHPLTGVRERRRAEAALIRSELGAPSAPPRPLH